MASVIYTHCMACMSAVHTEVTLISGSRYFASCEFRVSSCELKVKSSSCELRVEMWELRVKKCEFKFAS